ncbi:MAG: ABC transporter substrate-binding protein [Carbonactinosporaceae bacterium]
MRYARLMRPASAAAAAAFLTLATACAGAEPSGGARSVVPDIPMQQQVGPSEGELDLVIWTGYAEDGSTDPKVDWVTPFEKKTGCQVNTKVADTSDSMVSLMRTGDYDGVSASGDSSLRLIYSGAVAPVNTELVPNYRDIAPYLKDEPYNSVDGQMYGIPHGYGANVLMYRTDRIAEPPSSWDVVWEEGSPAAGNVTVYDSPIYIADAALYLKAHKPALDITNPYELTEEQFDAAVQLLKRQRSEVNQYWASYADELQSFTTGDNVAGTAWEVTANIAKAEGVPVDTTIPSEGATGWSDTWMLGSKAQHPNCMYKWMDWIASPLAQSEVAQWFGEAPANPKACNYTGQQFCNDYHVGDPNFYNSLAFWQTPVSHCGDDRGNQCVGYSRWSQAWTEIKG